MWPSRTSLAATAGGGLFSLKIASTSLVVVSSPEVAGAVVREQDGVFVGRPKPPFVFRELTYIGDQIPFLDYGTDYHFQRRLILQEMLNVPSVARFKRHRESEFDALVAAIHHVNGATAGRPETERAIKLRPFLRATFFNALATTAISQRFFDMPGEDTGAASGQLLEPRLSDSTSGGRSMDEIVELITFTFTIVDLFPSLGFLESLLLRKLKKRLNHIFCSLDAFLQGVVDQRRRLQQSQSQQQQQQQPRDVLDILLSFKHAGDQTLSDRMVKANIQMMILGGVDNTIVVVEWVLAELLRNPECMRKVQEEMDRVVGTQRAAEEADLANLPYFRAAVREGARLHPGGATLLPRRCTQDTEVGGYHIPSNTVVLVYVCAMQRDSTIWPEADRFLPERFLDWNGPDILRGHDFRYMPFGSGRRMCPGLHLGSAVIELALAKLLHSFNWSLPGELKNRPQDLNMLVRRTSLASMREPLRAVLAPRLSTTL